MGYGYLQRNSVYDSVSGLKTVLSIVAKRFIRPYIYRIEVASLVFVIIELIYCYYSEF